MDAFIQVNNKTVQDCTEPKEDPQDVFSFAVANKEGINKHKTYEGKSLEKRLGKTHDE